MNREVESASMRPLAKTLTAHLDRLRCQLREQSLRSFDYTQEVSRLPCAVLLLCITAIRVYWDESHFGFSTNVVPVPLLRYMYQCVQMQ